MANAGAVPVLKELPKGMTLKMGMGEVDRLKVKQTDLREKIRLNCARASNETSQYGTEEEATATVMGFVRSHMDLSIKIAEYYARIHHTNENTLVQIDLGGKSIRRTITQWIARRGGKDKNGLAKADLQAWQLLTDKNIKEGTTADSSGQRVEIKIVRHFSPSERDQMIAILRDEPSIIDDILENVNATTELLDLPQAAA